MSDQNNYGNVPATGGNDYGDYRGAGNYSNSNTQPVASGQNGAQHRNAEQNQHGGFQNEQWQNEAPQYQNGAQYPNAAQYQNQGFGQTQPPSYSGHMGYNNGVEPEKPATPKTLKIASWLIYAGIALSIISSIYQITNMGTLMENQMNQTGFTEKDLEDMGMTLQSFGQIVGWATLIIEIVWAALVIMFTVFMLKGANWARIVLTIIKAFGVFSIFSAIAVIATGQSAVMGLLGTLGGLLSIATLVFMWLKPSNFFFAKMRERKQWQAFNQYR